MRFWGGLWLGGFVWVCVGAFFCLRVGVSCRRLRLIRADVLPRALARWTFFAVASGRHSPLGGQGASFWHLKKVAPNGTKAAWGGQDATKACHCAKSRCAQLWTRLPAPAHFAHHIPVVFTLMRMPVVPLVVIVGAMPRRYLLNAGA